jgi:methyl-accepting chemotaxis protein
MATLGSYLLLAAFVVAAYAASMSVAGARRRSNRLIESGVGAFYLVAAIMFAASAIIIHAFVVGDYSIRYVQEASDSVQPLFYKLTAYWGGLDGSIMFWVFMLSMFGSAAVYANRETSPVEVSDEGIDGSEELVNELLDTERKAGSKALATSRNTVMAGSLAVMLGIVLVGAVVTTSVARPLSALKSGAEKIAGGDLDYEFKNIADDEVGSVIHSVQQMSVGLKSRIQTLQEAAGVVLLTGEEIGAEAEKAKAAGADTDAIIAKAEELKNLIGPMLG